MKKEISKNQKICILVTSIIAAVIIICFIFVGKGNDEQSQPAVSGGDSTIQEKEAPESALQEDGYIIMPDLSGKVLDDAAKLLYESNILYVPEWELNVNEAPQEILGQSITAGEKINPFTKVILTVNSLAPEVEEIEEESEEREVPDLTGLDVNEAMEQLLGRDLQLGYVRSEDEGGVEEEKLAEVELGQVCGQFPQGGTIVPKYKKVTLIIKTGATEETQK